MFLFNGITLQEARLSSEIENIVTTNDDFLKQQPMKKLAIEPQSKEVLRYREALWYGFKQLKKKRFQTNLFIELVTIIKGQKLGIRRVPGTKIGNSRGEIIYTPPEGESVIREN